ncbi:RNA-binding protein [Alkalicoccus daliensis]|uniref:RNA-binding protein YlmH, contains S4-like domain n=1 Tax=Alkalicoccus daliensis TaxID=745820 RepID=A0A1G9ZVX1_9BACI|nr:RNA-binding protein [Alkalicoccus daliensis]SDN25295.1 RNA-binding protein YlmH, contains S4-like domain [Alkalicoccus daliensis]
MSLYDHFRKEERPFIDQVLDWKSTVKEEYRSKLSDFLDPRQQQIVTSVVGTDKDVKLSFHGGASAVERKRALLYPEYMDPDYSDFELAAYELQYPSKFVTLEHPQVLGTLTSLGVRREKFGDILISGNRIQIVAAGEIAGYLEQQFTSVGRASVTMLSISLDDLLEPAEVSKDLSVTVSSMRLDTVLSEAFKISRSKIKPLIQNEKVKVNWKVIIDPSVTIEEGDVLSLRGSGRCKVESVEGVTKKGKLRVQLRVTGNN